MCCGSSSRVSVGGTIAILKPIALPAKQDSQPEMSVRLAEDQSTGTTAVIVDGLDGNIAENQVIIQ